MRYVEKNSTKFNDKENQEKFCKFLSQENFERFLAFFSHSGCKFDYISFKNYLDKAIPFGIKIWDFDKWISAFKCFDFTCYNQNQQFELMKMIFGYLKPDKDQRTEISSIVHTKLYEDSDSNNIDIKKFCDSFGNSRFVRSQQSDSLFYSNSEVGFYMSKIDIRKFSITILKDTASGTAYYPLNIGWITGNKNLLFQPYDYIQLRFSDVFLYGRSHYLII